MGSSKRLKISKYLSRAFDSTSESNVAQGSSASGRPDQASPLPEQFFGEAPQQAALLHPTLDHSNRFMGKRKSRSRSPSPSPSQSSRVDRRIATPVSQSLISADVLGRPHSLYSETFALPMHGPLSDNVAVVPSCDHGSPSSSGLRSQLIAGGNPELPSTCAPHIRTPTAQAPAPVSVNVPVDILPATKSTLVPDIIEPLLPSAMVWTKALEIAKKKLGEKNFTIHLTGLTSQPAEENIEAVIKTLNNIQEDKKKKQWSYTWHGKKVIVVENLGKILKTAERYSKVVDTAIQHQPEVTALVWAGIKAILQVRMYVLLERVDSPN